VVDGDCLALPESEDIPSRCNWGEAGYEEHPANCLTWEMAAAFCAWVGGALPSEAQWEYAARSGGLDRTYPWGEAPPSCDLAVINEDDCCGTGRTWPVCSKPDGNTAQGLCDMAGNAFEWVQDWYHGSYLGAPRTAEPWEVEHYALRSLRGGGISSDEDVRTRNRTFHDPAFFYSGMGARCVREVNEG
jgi:formylglycine-generating enzyme required for sulfatase activity